MFNIDIKQFLLFIFIGLMATACDEDDPAPEEHLDAQGFILEDANGNELYREFEGDIITNNISLSISELLNFQFTFLVMMVMKLNMRKRKNMKVN